MNPRIQHLIETPFSVAIGEHALIHSNEWLRGRLELLRNYYLPSLAAQTCQRFTCLLFCDESTDEDAMAELRDLEQSLPFLRIERTSGTRTMLAATISAVDPEADVLITTQIDSDDMIADHYVERVQEYAVQFSDSALPSLAINFPHGYRLDVANDALYGDYMPNSMYHSLLERPGGNVTPKTVFELNHTLVHRAHPTHQDCSDPAWIAVIHGGNLVNQIHGAVRFTPFDKETVPGFTFGGMPLNATLGDG